MQYNPQPTQILHIYENHNLSIQPNQIESQMHQRGKRRSSEGTYIRCSAPWNTESTKWRLGQPSSIYLSTSPSHPIHLSIHPAHPSHRGSHSMAVNDSSFPSREEENRRAPTARQVSYVVLSNVKLLFMYAPTSNPLSFSCGNLELAHERTQNQIK